MEHTEPSKKDVFLWNEGDSVKGLIITNVRQLSTWIIHMQETLPAFWTFTSSFEAQEVLIMQFLLAWAISKFLSKLNLIRYSAYLSVAQSLVQAHFVTLIEES